jgi:predicted transposase/invertase (TIGR01784 family)
LTERIEPIGIVALIDDRPEGEKKYYLSQQFGVTSFYEYLTVPILDLPDEVLLANDNRIGLVLYALKCAKKSGNDQGMKFRYLKELSRLWAQRKWAPEDKRMILLALDYQMQLSDQGYRRQLADYVEELTEAVGKEEKQVYVSIFEEVYTEKGMAKGMAQGMAQGIAQGMTQGIAQGRSEGYVEVARNMLRKGFSIDSVAECTTLPRSEVESLANL